MGNAMKPAVDTYYLFKVWGFTLVIAPLLLLMVGFGQSGITTNANIWSSFGYFFVYFIYGFLYSIPSFLIAILLFISDCNLKIEGRYLKVVFVISLLIGMIVTSYLVFGQEVFTGSLRVFPICYGIAIVSAGWKSRLSTMPITSASQNQGI